MTNCAETRIRAAVWGVLAFLALVLLAGCCTKRRVVRVGPDPAPPVATVAEFPPAAPEVPEAPLPIVGDEPSCPT